MHSRLVLSVLAAIACLPGASFAQQCPTGYTAATVTGRVTTMNISQTRQVGQICLVMTTADGREVFDDCGALVGKVTAMDAAAGTSTLNHTAVFELFESFQTNQDAAQITGVLDTDADGNPCALSVTEHMTKLRSGTGIFNGATIDVIANGSISFCPDKNLNNFQLSGQGCLRSRNLRKSSQLLRQARPCGLSKPAGSAGTVCQAASRTDINPTPAPRPSGIR
jgi:hypothetical protein